ncbi:hypothetical protein [Allokutzneria albata]|uniref:hypothetical protein n=1 Tax=Allokutzneria albata TaxID=211114 RepID=UPI0012DD65E6|nr:hypothetical protein [Allokutzneria albata]
MTTAHADTGAVTGGRRQAETGRLNTDRPVSLVRQGKSEPWAKKVTRGIALVSLADN